MKVIAPWHFLALQLPKSWRYLALMALWTHIAGASAEPTPLVSRFMDIPASTFDLGMVRVQSELDSYEPTKGYRISYKWETNEFLIKKTIFNLEKKHCDGIEACEAFIKNLFIEQTGSLCFSSDDAKPTCDLLNIMSNFSHVGYNTKNFYQGMTDEEASDKLKEITTAQLSGFFRISGKVKKITCERRFTETSLKCY